MVKAITDATFEQETKDGLVLVDFWATWCGPCRMQGPILDKLSEELSEDVLKIVKMDVDENPNTARCFRHYVYPLLFFSKKMDKWLNKLLVFTLQNKSRLLWLSWVKSISTPINKMGVLFYMINCKNKCNS